MVEITDLAAARWRESMLPSDVCSSNQIKIYSSPGFSDDSFACFSSSREYNVPFLLECLQRRAPGEWRTTWLLGSSNMGAGFLLPAPSYVVCPVHVQSRSWSNLTPCSCFFQLWVVYDRQNTRVSGIRPVCFGTAAGGTQVRLYSQRVPCHQAASPALGFWPPFVAQTVQSFCKSPGLVLLN